MAIGNSCWLYEGPNQSHRFGCIRFHIQPIRVGTMCGHLRTPLYSSTTHIYRETALNLYQVGSKSSYPIDLQRQRQVSSLHCISSPCSQTYIIQMQVPEIPARLWPRVDK